MIDLNFANNYGKLLFEELKDLIEQILPGKVSTYNEIAKALGDPIARKFVYYHCKISPYWYRVVNSQGIVNNFFQKKLLEKEGIRFEGNKIANFEKLIFKEFKSSSPLKKLKDIQNRLAERVIIDYNPEFNKVIGIDLSYKNNTAFTVIAEFDKNKKLKDYFVKKFKVSFLIFLLIWHLGKALQ